MTTSLPVFDFSTTPEERANEQAKIDEAIASAEKAMKDAPAVRAIKEKQFKDALVAESIAAKPLIKAKKAVTKKAAKGSKSGRVVGISADENKMLYNLLQAVQSDSNYATISSDESFKKLQARYNK